MKTIQMTIDEPLLDAVDQVIRDLKTTRSAFIRFALQLALEKYAILKLKQQHVEGYAKHPVVPGEFDIWESEQAWGEK